MANFTEIDEEFICEHCGKKVEKLNYSCRDHCSHCLYAKHVDINPGDRMETCHGLLRPIAIENNPKKGYVIVYRCEKCGKIMTEKYGSGRFCCRSCANSHKKSEQTKNKISIKAKKNREATKSKQLELQKKSYYSNPKKCVICNNIIPFEHKNRKTCCETCYKKHLSKIAKKNKLGGITKGHGTGRGGNYKNIHCDSKYELIFLVYCIELNINIERNFTFFVYTDKDNKQHKYYPDFYFPDLNMFIEIKGYFQENTKYKIKAMAEYGIKHKVLYWEDLKPCLALIKEKFNLSYNSIHKLYDQYNQ